MHAARRLSDFLEEAVCRREALHRLLELYGQEVTHDLISTITDELLAEVEQWQQ